jgi:capsular exopolysaccharide synthesis family protein
VRLRELEREAAASRRVYEAFLQRQQEITDQERMNSTDARLVSYARTPGAPFSPNLRIALVIAIMVGLFFGFVAGIVAEMLDRSIHGPDDLENKVGYPAITSVPAISKRSLRTMPPTASNPPGYLVERPMSGFTEALRVLRTVIVHSRLDAATRVVAIASALPGEGKTTISMSLARVAAMSGQKVIVVDCDLRKRSINDILDIEPDVGLLQVLAGEVGWRDALRRDELTHADILPVAASNFTPLDVFGSDAMKRLLAELRNNYELVVLDCAPLLAVAEPRVVVTLADGVVIIAQVGKSTSDAVRTAIEHTVSAGGSVVGVALNRVPVEGLGRFSYSDAHYYYESKSYYSTP